MLCILIGAIILSINIQEGLNMHLYDDIGDASSSLRGSTFSFSNKINGTPKVLYLPILKLRSILAIVKLLALLHIITYC